MAIKLFKHNQDAYNSALKMLNTNGKAAIIHPTGTGKSFIGFKLCEDSPEKSICWLSPSDYIFKTQLENLSKVSNGYKPNNIKFYTYARLMNLTEDELAEIHPDFIVLDEFHRCGAEQWGKGVNTLLEFNPDVPLLGLSATNIRYLDNQRDMADELFEGNIASEITLGEAIVRGILAAPKYVISVYSYQKELEKYEQRIRSTRNKAVRDASEQYLDALRRTLEKSEGLDDVFYKHMSVRNGKYIVFCANYEHMQEMISKSSEWFRKVDSDPHIYSVYSSDPSASESFEAFKKDNDINHLRLLYCIDALNEGIHLDDINGVILFRPTVSPIIYKQQIGRALSAHQKNDPVIFDIVNNFENLYSINAIKDEMAAAITYYRFQGTDGDIVNENFKIIDELRDCKRLFDGLNDTLSTSWDAMYEVAKRYYTEHGDLVPKNNYKTKEGYSLGAWLNTQRMIRRGTATSGYLTDSQIKKLDAIGMRWETKQDCIWEKNYGELLNYYNEHGDVNVPSNYVTETGFALGNWISHLRGARKSGIKQGILTEERIALLDSLGMIWDKVDYIWETNYSALLDYYKQHGNINFTKSYKTKEGIALGAWIYNIRVRYRMSNGCSLTGSQKERLEAVGVDLSYETSFEKRWNTNYKYAKQYYIENGNLNVPYSYVTKDGFTLGIWISKLRVANKRKTHLLISDDRKSQLNAIGMIWDGIIPTQWDEYYDAVKQYYQENGNIKVTSHTIYNNLFIGSWLVQQRQQYRRGQLSPEKIRALDEFGMDWMTQKERQWEDAYSAAKMFYDEHGNLKVPTSMSSTYSWLVTQRKKYRENALTEEQYNRLNSIGMQWEISDEWDSYYAEAKRYYQENGNLDIPADYVTSTGIKLGRWYRSRRKEYINGTMSSERIKLMEDIGIEKKSVLQRNWMQNYQYAKAFFEKNGHLKINSKYVTPDGVKLGVWISSQRENYKLNRLNNKQISLLESINMNWNCFDESWDSYYKAAQNYYKKYNNLNVTSEYQTEDGIKLGAWIASQRTKFKNFKLSKIQIDKLNAIGMSWSRNDTMWNDGYSRAETYYKTYGNLDLDSKYISPDGFRLGSWIANKRTSYKKGKLTNERVEMLEKIGMDFKNNKSASNAATERI